ncbi:MAG: hypothetical protein JJ974_12185 [Phycisphaerales bacterium]|nr:hypothetical protein [Phycisphaerales bacterium]
MDHEDRIFSFTWRAGEPYLNLQNGKMTVSQDDLGAAARQVQNILHRATGRTSGEFRIQNPNTRLMHRRWSHLVLADYMGGSVTDPMWADPADTNQLNWQLNPLDYQEGSSVPYANGQPAEAGYDDLVSWQETRITQLWPFASSYQVVPHAWMQDYGNQYFPTATTPHVFLSNGFSITLGERRFDDVRFPSAKVHMFEEFDRELAGSPYFAYDHAAPTKLMFDGSINTAMSGLAASSVSSDDYRYGRKIVWEQTYVPLDTFPVPLGGLGDETLLNMRYRWTLGGLSGVDYPQVIMRGSGR